MHLAPNEIDKLYITQVGQLSQLRLSRGIKLNYVESIGLISYICSELIRDGHNTVSDIMSIGRTILGINQCIIGVPSMINEIQLEGTFKDGTKLVTIHNPITNINGDLKLAFKYSNYTIPKLSMFNTSNDDTTITPSKRRKTNNSTKTESTTTTDDTNTTTDISLDNEHSTWLGIDTPGRYILLDDDIRINENKNIVTIHVTNTDDRPIQVGSHYNFIETNKYLLFDRRYAYGRRLNIPSGTAIRFEPGETKQVQLVSIGGNQIIRGGNNIVNDKIDNNQLDSIINKLIEQGFKHKPVDNVINEQPNTLKLNRDKYASMYGPTTGDCIQLADTCLIARIEYDLTSLNSINYGNECKFGGGKVLRDGMGQATGRDEKDTLDLLISNVVIIDYTGIYKADIGIKNNIIVGVGKGGNPDTMDGINNNMICGNTTESIDGSNLIITAGAIDAHVHFICPQLVQQALYSGITTMLGGGTGPTSGTNATTCTPGSNNLHMMFTATDNFPLNFGFTGKGNSALPNGLIEQVQSGACGLKLHEDWATTPSNIDCALTIADQYDIQITIHTDTLNESTSVEGTVQAFKNRTIHAYHTEGAGGGHAPDIITVCSQPNVIPSSTNPTRPYTVNTIDEHVDMLMVCHHLDKNIAEDISFAESRIRGETIQAEDILHDIGAISIMASDSQAMGRIGEVISRTWQCASKMKVQRGRLDLDCNKQQLHNNIEDDNERIKRYISKYTINPCIAHGFNQYIGSIEVGKYADLVLWKPSMFGVKPEIIIKGGIIVTAQMGDANASIPTPEPVLMRPMYGSYGYVPQQRSMLFVSQYAAEHITQQEWHKKGVYKNIVGVKNCRNIGKNDMIYNSSMPHVTVDPETFIVKADNVELRCKPAKKLPLTDKYFLY